jgi:hypothetical protein
MFWVLVVMSTVMGPPTVMEAIETYRDELACQAGIAKMKAGTWKGAITPYGPFFDCTPVPVPRWLQR